jgi:hypothetical protein
MTALESDPVIKAYRASIENNPTIEPVLEKKGLKVTELGKQFARICVVPKQ